MGKNILLVYPRIPDNTYWSFSHALPFIGKKTSMPPLGLATIARMIPKGYNIRFVDENLNSLKDEDIAWSDLVFTSSIIIQNNSLKNIISRTINIRKRIEKDIRIVAGGPYPTQYYDKISGVDHFIMGEAESGVLEQFLSDIEKGIAKKAYARFQIRQRNKATDEREYKRLTDFFGADNNIELIVARPDMSLSPIPKYDLLEMDKYSSMSIQMSRGCPHNCDFCTEGALFGDQARVKTSERFISELKTIYDLGYRGYLFIVDDNFIGNPSKTKDVLKELKRFQEERNYPFMLYTEASINLANDEELLGLMRDSRFNMVFVGIESPDKDVLKSMNKGINVNSNLVESIRKIQSFGMEVTGGFITGNDNDPDDVYDRIFDLCQEAGIPTAMVGQLDAMRGSELYERLKREGRLLEDTDGNNTHSFELNFIPQKAVDIAKQKGIKQETEEYNIVVAEVMKNVSKKYKNLLARLYDKSGKNYFERCKTLFDNLGSNPKPSRDVRWTEIRAFAMSLFAQGFSYHSAYYAKFLADSLTRHMKLFPEAVTKAIIGRHLLKITRDSLKANKLYNSLSEKFDYFKERVEQGLAEGNVLYSKMIKEKDIFLENARKKIERFPRDYKPKLNEAYRRLDCMFKPIRRPY